ncbi:hypothetical protein BCF33_2609 [Hasllibacter halocynthiae]|uniref:Small secreted protein n=1 Tax=Hasllibacter halocynthiae TaxID=595589 RepID=A0A2T0X497_9RHOB|nr:hypothetical protein [Hasllibacter halocynthiae]PRY93725.1 hypothetical protein BCF33_2609 [Hasllibacter halocynthiae]
MPKSLALILALLAVPVLSACAPLVGAGAVVAADEIAESEGDNLF